jgi:hypothetical protein
MIRNWANLLAMVNGQGKEAEEKKETASVTGQADHMNDISVAASDENSGVNQGTSMRNFIS